MSYSIYTGFKIQNIDNLLVNGEVADAKYLGEVDERPDIYEKIKFNGRTYVTSVINDSSQIVIVEEVKVLDQDTTFEYEKNAICPYCGTEQTDSWELSGDDGEENMDIREEILNKYKKFNDYLENIDLNSLRNNFSRQELNDFKNKLYDIKIRSLPYEISNMTKEMKEEEYPELLGIHHYPILKEIDFLTEKEKMDLDNFLVKFIPNRDFVQTFWKVVKSPKKTELLKKYLIEKGVVEERYVVKCPNCHQGHLSKMMSNEKKEELKTLLHNKATYYKLEPYLNFICDDCFDELDPYEIDEFSMQTYLILVMERDKSLDHV
ncbi:hypothetical protein [Virgibacillus halodenitrificans]|uniref:hypothetical protein n=1 Tax=Virgibacillus halodenitrificans TaxID=1482 RepID=UPI000EF43F37|nr:hypothetical protein [Virgibacillus halodenitrificans]